MLPGIDDGPSSLESSVAMARLAVDDGITTTFCTPHIYPGLYENDGPAIKRAVANLQLILNDKGIPLTLSFGADTHLVPEVLDGVASGRIPTLGGSKFLLLEPSHHVRPPGFTEAVFRIITSGYVPVITHPERLSWVGAHIDEFFALARSGAWLQVTSGALIGRFGAAAKRHAERFVGEGWCDVLASDGHTTGRRAPVMSEARIRAAELVGESEATAMTVTRPQHVLTNGANGAMPRPFAHRENMTQKTSSHRIIALLANRLLGRSSE
jgi:protein-tyrosine phosphatase